MMPKPHRSVGVLTNVQNEARNVGTHRIGQRMQNPPIEAVRQRSHKSDASSVRMGTYSVENDGTKMAGDNAKNVGMCRKETEKQTPPIVLKIKPSERSDH